jgi:hypothetical protein
MNLRTLEMTQNNFEYSELDHSRIKGSGEWGQAVDLAHASRSMKQIALDFLKKLKPSFKKAAKTQSQSTASVKVGNSAALREPNHGGITGWAL